MILCRLSWAVVRAEQDQFRQMWVAGAVHRQLLESQGTQVLPRTRSGPEICIKMASFPYTIMISLPHQSEELVCMLHMCTCGVWAVCAMVMGEMGELTL